VVIMESTYGNRDHPPYEDARQTLGRVVRETAARGGRVLIPAFAVGRTQELVYDLHGLLREGKIPQIPIVIDSPLAIDATGVFAANPDIYDRSEALVQATRELFQFGLVRYTRASRSPRRSNAEHGPMVIIAASGMAESGRILHHLAARRARPAQHHPDRRLPGRAHARAPHRGAAADAPVFGDEVPLRATSRC
jgi:metallo-beta-lactamase family protein